MQDQFHEGQAECQIVFSLPVEGVDQITVHASSPWAERAFCKHCGTHLYCRLLAKGEYFVPAGAIDSNQFEIGSQIFIDKKPESYALANQTPMLTEQEVLAKFAPADDDAAR